MNEDFITQEPEEVPMEERQKHMTRDEIRAELENKSESVFDPENAPKIQHHWVHRGIEHVCVSPTHPRHVAYSRFR